MHIEPGIVTGAKLVFSYGSAIASIGLAAKLATDTIKHDGGLGALVVRSAATTALVFSFFELLPHHPIGVSEVHFILASTLFLVFGGGATAIGLALGLLLQGVLFAPADLPQYGINLTTLLVPLYAMSLLAKKMIPAQTAYKDVSYGQALALSTAFQGGVVAWVAFWALFGGGFGAENLANVASFGGAYMLVVLVEPLIDLGVLAVAKGLGRSEGNMFLHHRLYQSEA